MNTVNCSVFNVCTFNVGSKGELPRQNLQIELMICLRMQERICHCSVASKIGVLCKLMNLILIGEKCPKVITMYIINLPLNEYNFSHFIF